MANFFTQNINSVHVHAISNAAVNQGQATFPVVIMEPGLGPIATDYITLAEDLASHGYIVVGVTPTYSANMVVFPDGRIATRAAAGNPPDTVSAVESQQLLDHLITVWVGDDRFTLDQMEKLNAGDPAGRFTGRMNLQSVGVFGHSFGGAAAAEVCHLDDRFKAGIDLDGDPYGDVITTGLNQPFMFILSEPTNVASSTRQEADQNLQAIYNNLRGGGYQITIKGIRHFNFSDHAGLFQPFLKLLGDLGPIDGRRGLSISVDYIRAMFDKYLKGTDEPLLKGASIKYPEVTFVSH